ncbi:MAG: hypothetical protein HKN06_13725, partial [Gammaproteobacteria bacterium]|nr:hypothetical protein [Gammaproteobacteria bacterium]
MLLAFAGCAGKSEAPLFVDAAAQAGLEFMHEPGDRGKLYIPEIASGGVALLDYDSDGDLDVFFPQSGFLGPPAIEPPVNALFENQLEKGGLRFADATAGSGLETTGYSMGTAVGDYDGNGRPDLYITAFGSNFFFRNDSDGRFTDITATTDTDDPRWSSSAAFFDFDNDDDLDLFVSNYVSFSLSHNKKCRTATGEREYCAPDSYESVPDRLFRNEAKGFQNISREAGLERAYGAGLGVAVANFNGDSQLDVYVANDGKPNQLWIGDGNGFTERGLASGSAYNAEGMTEASMGVTAGDFDGDGDDDLFMTHLRNETNTLYENDGSANFVDITQRTGVGTPGRRLTGFGTSWIDFDNDGLLDLFVANGAVISVPGQQGPFPLREPNQLFRNIGNGFVDVSADAGPDVTVELVSRGAAFGDVDNDGDTDIVVVNANGPAQLLLNQIGNKASWIGIDLRPAGIPGYHARAAVAVGDKVLWRTSRRDGSYLSSSDPRILVGLGRHDGPVDVLVEWRNRAAEVWPGLSARSYHALTP